MYDIQIIVPVLNEQDSVEELVYRINNALSSKKINYGIIFVDDNSTDNTLVKIRELQKFYPIIIHQKQGRRGKAFSILEGVKIATSDILAMIDGDLQYPPEALPQMYELAKNCGVVVANRHKNNISMLRRIGSNISSQFVGRLLLGINCDSQSGLKVFKKHIVQHISEKDVKPWAFDMPLLYTALELGEKIGTVEIDFLERAKGKSKVKFLKTAIEIVLTALKLKLGRKIHILPPKDGHFMLGAGIVHKKKKYITHTLLHHNKSALMTFSRWQKIFFSLVAFLLIIGIFTNFFVTVVVLIAILSTIYLLDVLFSLWVLTKSLHRSPEINFREEDLAILNEKLLPIYTVLCPLYKEGKVLQQFVNSIKEIDWPKEKLEVILLLEEDDIETLNVARSIDIPDNFKIVVVPDSIPKTKPKACNYGLSIAKGEYVVVYDAEDKPEPLQLKKAYLGFQKLGDKVFCLQSKLNYFNPNQNILTRLFTAEYSFWFDIALPGLQTIDASIPLGGTSNHFRTKDLLSIHGWDPFNVTEDCDLGVRIFKAGHKTAIIDSTTYEEANSSIRNWIRQRSRWIKGYLQTYLVHMREPVSFIKSHGIHAFIFQLVIGMRIAFLLINPFLWVMTIAYFAARNTLGPTIETLYPAPVFYMAGFALVIGNFMYIYNYMIGLAKRNQWWLIKYVFAIPFYWFLASIAAVKAIYQLFYKPHFWEKTHHGFHLSERKFNLWSAFLEFNTKNLRLASTYRFKSFFGVSLSSGVFLIFAGVLANFFDFLTATYLGRKLSTEEFGIIGMMLGFLFVIQLPFTGLSQMASHNTAFLFGKFKRPVGQLWNEYSKKIANLTILLSFLWFVGVPLLYSFFNSNTYVPFIALTPVWIFVAITSLGYGILEGNMKFGLIGIALLLTSFSKLVLSVFLTEIGLTEWIYIVLPVSLAIGTIAVWLFCRRLSFGNSKNFSTNLGFKKHAKFSKEFYLSATLANVSAISFLGIDMLFVKHFLSREEAGYYALLSVVGRIVYIVGGFFSQFIVPLISKEYGKIHKSNKLFFLILFLVFLSTGGAFLALGPFGLTTLKVLFGDKALAIVNYSTPFTLAMVLFSIGYSFVIYHLAKRNYIFSFAGIISAIFQFLGLYFFHQNISEVVGVMLATSGLFLAITITLHIFYKRFIFLISNINDLIGIFKINKVNNEKSTSKSLRILIYNWRDIKHVWAGGAEVYVHELAKRWVNSGHSVTLFCSSDGKSKREEIIDGVQIVRRGGFFTVYVWAVLYYIFYFRKKCDVIVESENGIPFFTPLYSKKPKALIVHHVHQEVFREHLKFPLSVIAIFIEKVIAPLVYSKEVIIAVSESTKKDLLKIFGYGAKIKVITPGINITNENNFEKTNYPSFVYLGRHKSYKNIDVAIFSFAKLLKKYPNSKLNIAGFGDKTQELIGLVKSLGIEKSVLFLGRVTEKEKFNLLGSAWAALQPSSFEGWGITVLEANVCGTPVIASKVSGLKDSVLHMVTGILVPVKDVESFSKAMELVIDNTKLRKKMSQEAIKWSLCHSWDDKAYSFLNLIEILAVKGVSVRTKDIVPSPSYSHEDI